MSKKKDTELALRNVGAGGELVRAQIELQPNPWAEMYLSGLKSPRSRPAQRSALDSVARIMTGLPSTTVSCRNFPWQVVTVLHMRTLKAKLIEQYQTRTLNRMLSAVKGVLKVCWEAEVLSTDQYTRARSVTGESTHNLEPAGRWVPQDEIEKLLDAARAQPEPRAFRDQAIVVLMYSGGLRRQEASSMNTDNYREKDGEIRVVKGKRGKFRTTYMADGFRAWLRPWVEFQRERGSEPMFVRWHRTGPGTARLGEMGVDRVLRELCKKAKINPVTPHDLRRSFATELLEADADLLMVQELMGHANVATTKIYDRRGEQGKRKAAAKFPVIAYKER